MAPKLMHPWDKLSVEVAVKIHKALNNDDEDMSVYEYIVEAEKLVEWCSRVKENALSLGSIEEKCAEVMSKSFNESYKPNEFTNVAELILNRIRSSSFARYIRALD
jgi:hypothetical protein